MEFKVDAVRGINEVFTCINRIRLEFKDTMGDRSTQGSGRINRIRLEFKVCCLRLTGSTAEVVLIESDWNLKQSSTDLGLTLGAVLIESDWNLKKIMFSISQVSVAVLIESDWNLKLNPSTIEKLPTVVLIESDWNLKEIIQR